MVIPASTIRDQKRITSSTNSNCTCPYVKCYDSDSDDCTDKYLKEKSKSDPTSNKDCNENLTNAPDLSPLKPKGILVRHESEDGLDKKSKSNRTVSFTLDDSKKPFTTSIYYGVKSYLHHFYEPVNKTAANGDSYIDDDFEFVVEPGRQRRKYYWYTWTLVLGIVIALGAAYLVLVRFIDGPAPRGTLMDPWQMLGVTMFCSGSLIIIFSLLSSAYESRYGCFKIPDQMQCPRSSWDSGNSWIRYGEIHPLPLYDNGIPLSEEITAPQMNKSKN